VGSLNMWVNVIIGKTFMWVIGGNKGGHDVLGVR